MIRYALRCDQAHGFEAWFGSFADYDDQAARGLVQCPYCGSRAVDKQIMAPAVRARDRTPDAPSREAAARLQTLMLEAARQVRTHVEAEFDYVGDAFAREARDIHEGRSEQRAIYGEATQAEVKKLQADGVPVAPLPPPPPEPNTLN